MTNQSTIDKLIEMRLTAMADAFRIQMDDPAMKEVPFEDRFGMLVDVECILFLDHNAEFNNTETSQMPYTHRDLYHIASEIT